MEYRGFMIFASGRVEEVDPDGVTFDLPTTPSLYDDLVLAGYPLHRDDDISRYNGIIDLRIEGNRVIAHTTGPMPREHDMGPVSGLFLEWLQRVDYAS